ncbi:MAG: hypothetical protein ACEQSB_01090 [Undibacterium sp.]
MTLILRVGLVVIAVITIVAARLEFFMPKSIECRQSVAWNEAAPHGAIWTAETIHWDQVPPGYTTLVGWINAATVIPCADASQTKPAIEIRQIRIIGIEPDGKERLVETIDPRDTGRFVGRIFPRIPHWFGETEGTDDAALLSGGEDGVMLGIDQVPLRVYHAWTNPRVLIDPTLRYAIEIEAKISETARLQLGIDYWRDQDADYAGWDANCIQSNNCEGLVSDWYGSTEGEFRVFRAPKKFQTPIGNPVPTP